ncbi:acyl-CoA dehydrogenase [Chromatiales bacterium (ex Bugula neritina AB1)]|nr:acyl-CoA dehydrogenase [Chromatiales bacterium (ex Bugula neritina AB1)]
MTGIRQRQLAQADACLAVLRIELEVALRHLHRLCSEDGRLSAPLLDASQSVSYALAFAKAEIEASQVMLKYAAGVVADSTLVTDMALVFCAGNIRTVWHRLLAHSTEAGLCQSKLLGLMGSDPLAGFLAEHGEVSRSAALGAQLVERNSVHLPSGLDTEKDMIRESFARFTEQVVMPQAEHIHRFDTDIPEDIIKGAAELGCFGTSIPERFGGLMPDEPHDSISMLVVTEELSRGSLGAAGSLITRPEIAARALLAGGTEAQKQLWLPRLASGEKLAAIALTEPDFGSNVAGLSLKARQIENGWVLNGAKTWCTFAGRADVVVVIARTDPDSGKGHRGLSMFMVEKPPFTGHEFNYRNSAGGSLSGKAIPTIGYRGMHSYDLSFDNLVVPDTALVGGEAGLGKGFHLAMAGLSGGRIQTSARACGVMKAALERAVSYSIDRKVFDASIGSYQLTQVKLARMWAALTASRQFSYAVARMLDSGAGKMEASLVKLFSCHAAEWVTREAMQIHGGLGYAEETDVSRYFVDARVLSIFEGTEETLALKVIARELIASAGRNSMKENSQIENYLTGNH